jgi:hypothetical protein
MVKKRTQNHFIDPRNLPAGHGGIASRRVILHHDRDGKP